MSSVLAKFLSNLISWSLAMRNLLALVVLVLVGCANPQVAYQKTMDTWIGVSEDNLISRWGVPSGTYESNNA